VVVDLVCCCDACCAESRMRGEHVALLLFGCAVCGLWLLVDAVTDATTLQIGSNWERLHALFGQVIAIAEF
jgi:hypothetical protein